MKKCFYPIALVLGMVLATGCGPTREDYRDDLAIAHCERAKECGNLSIYNNSYDDCILEKRSDFNDVWPAQDCDDNRINPDRFESCLLEVQGRSCNTDVFTNLREGAEFNDRCASSKVCVDPRS